MVKTMVRAKDFPFFPGVFLVGAPRCGTTSISKFLAAHPQICFSRPKEPHYFNRVEAGALTRIRQDYLDRYFGHYDQERHSVAAEGSVSYLYQPEALEKILGINPEARFIVAVRNPIDMLRSYHYRMLYLLEEEEEDFVRAWGLQRERACGERVPRRCRDPRLLLYREVASFGRQIESLYELAGPDRCHIVVNDDLKNCPVDVYRDLFRFVGVDDEIWGDESTQFPRRLRSKSYRWRWLQALLYKPPGSVVKAVERGEIRRAGGPSTLKRMRKRLLKFNRVERDPAPFAPEVRVMLREAFAEDIAKLEGLLGRDLGHWR